MKWGKPPNDIRRFALYCYAHATCRCTFFDLIRPHTTCRGMNMARAAILTPIAIPCEMPFFCPLMSAGLIARHAWWCCPPHQRDFCWRQTVGGIDEIGQTRFQCPGLGGEDLYR